MRDLLLIGAGGHAQSVIDIIECKNEWVIKGLVGIDSEIDKEVLGYKIIASDKQLERLRKKYNYAFISIGQIKSSILRFVSATISLIANDFLFLLGLWRIYFK